MAFRPVALWRSPCYHPRPLARASTAVAKAPSGADHDAATATTTTAVQQSDTVTAPPSSLDSIMLASSLSSSSEPWKTLLERPARAAWRVSDRSSDPSGQRFRQAVQDIMQQGHSNKKQATVTHQNIIASHQALALARDGERKQMLQANSRRRPHHDGNPRIVTTPVVNPVVYGAAEALAQLRFRALPNFCVTRRVLQEVQSLLGSTWTAPLHVLDFGVGTGGAAAAALSLWNVQWLHGVDASPTMREAGEKVLTEFVRELPARAGGAMPPPRITMAAHLTETASTTTTTADHATTITSAVLGTFDLALMTYTATELPHNAATLAAAAMLWDKLRPNGVLVMIEPGTPDGFSSVRMVRNMLLSACGADNDDDDDQDLYCHTVAPCTHNGPCPMERFPTNGRPGRQPTQVNVSEAGHDDTTEAFATRKGFCSFVQTMGGSTENNEKFSYVVLQKRRRDAAFETSSERNDSARLLQSQLTATKPLERAKVQEKVESLEGAYLDMSDDDLGLELVRDSSSDYGRIIHAPLKRKGHVWIDCCTGGGIVRHKVTKSMGSKRAAPGLYTAARKARWGGLWPNVPATREQSPTADERWI